MSEIENDLLENEKHKMALRMCASRMACTAENAPEEEVNELIKEIQSDVIDMALQFNVDIDVLVRELMSLADQYLEDGTWERVLGEFIIDRETKKQQETEKEFPNVKFVNFTKTVH